MKKYLLILLSIFLLTGSYIFSQNEKDREYIKSRSNVKKLLEMSERFHEDYEEGMSKAGQLKMLHVNKRGKTGYLAGFDRYGNPVYDYEDNYHAAITSKVNVIRTGGSGGLDLDGSDIEIGQWEAGGLPRVTHQELAGRVTHAENSPTSSHSTHTACTMIGTGVDTLAGGMAPEATVLSYRSNDDEAELSEFAAAGGIISNHSYSTGDPDGDVIQYGIYTYNSAEWDEIMYYAPYLTVCKSAGNDRNDDVNPDDNGYDILFSVALSKNLLTIGAVDDIDEYTGPGSVHQSDFSSWGPTDDWRVKPDLVANGVKVFSADDGGNYAYRVRSGTSMSTPVTSGTIALLQQYYHKLNNVFMRSATVKALLVCTADEAGENDGPDFQNGWGLLNAEKAADVIAQNGKGSWIKELSLMDGRTFIHYIYVDSGVPVNLTVAWTDPPGEPREMHDNLTPMLVNDLDVRIIGNGKVYEPWVMVPNDEGDNFADAAVKGDNYRDNVERIDVKNMPAGLYAVKVTHKGSLKGGSQDFSMVINGLSVNTSYGKELKRDEELVLLYPQPVSDGILNVKLPDKFRAKDVNVSIYDCSGMLLKIEKQNTLQFKMNVSGLSRGMYIVHIRCDSKVVTGRFIVD